MSGQAQRDAESFYEREAERDDAEAAVDRVRALCDEMESWPVQTPKAIAINVRAALDGPR